LADLLADLERAEMVLPKRGHRTTEFYVAAVAGVVALSFGVVLHWDAALYAGAALESAYALARGIAKAGFGRAAHG
jgi:hypothetical protein